MITSLVPMALALVAAASPAGALNSMDIDAGRRCADPAAAPAALVAIQPPQGAQQQDPVQKGAGEKGVPSDTKKKPGAGEQVRRYMDEHAPKIADWLFDSPTPSTSFEGEPLRNRGLRAVPPVDAARFSSSNVTVLQDLGVVIAGADPKIVYVSSMLSTGIGAPIDLRPNDVILTLNGQPVETPQAFQSRYSRMPNGSPVELGLRRGSVRLSVAFYKPSERERARTTPPISERSGTILPD